MLIDPTSEWFGPQNKRSKSNIQTGSYTQPFLGIVGFALFLGNLHDSFVEIVKV
jgi:hypothetical protein